MKSSTPRATRLMNKAVKSESKLKSKIEKLYEKKGKLQEKAASKMTAGKKVSKLSSNRLQQLSGKAAAMERDYEFGVTGGRVTNYNYATKAGQKVGKAYGKAIKARSKK
jgi:hypothetical protein